MYNFPMDTQELKNGIENHKKRSPKTYNDIINITIPLYLLHQKIYNGICELQEKKYSITNAELDVLASLVMGGGDNYTLSPTELYGRLLFSSGGMTKILKRLEDKEYIIRLDNKEDKRSKLVKLTKIGRNIVDNALKDVIEYEKEYFQDLTDEEKETLKNLLFKVLKRV